MKITPELMSEFRALLIKHEVISEAMGDADLYIKQNTKIEQYLKLLHKLGTYEPVQVEFGREE